MNKSVIPFGPFHEHLYEPLNLTLELRNDTIVSATPSFGYAYRGIERYLSGMNCYDALPAMEKVCGMCGFHYSLAFCKAIEEMQGTVVPPRAVAARIVASELTLVQSRLYSIMWALSSTGNEKTADIAAHLRDKTLDLFELTTGRMFMSGFCIPGGVSTDIEKEPLLHIHLGANELQDDLKTLELFIRNDLFLRNRLKGVGVLSMETALKECLVGPAARAAGAAIDSRAGDSAYENAGFILLTDEEGGCGGRLRLSIAEIRISLEIIANITSNMPDSELTAKMPDYALMKQGETVAFAEQSGGELALYLKLNAGGEIEKITMRSATSANMHAAINLLTGADMKDISMILASMGICISCFER
jgi:Ni,Fe-hydrogenase III large subunit